MGRFLYFLILLFLLRLLFKAVVAAIASGSRQEVHQGSTPSGNTPQTIHKGKMVRDPVCGLHLPEHRAIVEVRGDERVYFCSERCQQNFSKAS